MSENKNNLYALLVGINDYPNPVRPLRGTHTDVKRIKAYLETVENEYFNLKIHPPLLDGEATKEKVTKTFLAHLGQAQSDDVALFFFSGHGTQEKADKTLWPLETDGKLECLLCHDSITMDDEQQKLLADKELRWMISKVATSGAHVIIIIDSCHSGDITRDSWLSENSSSMASKRAGRAGRMQSVFKPFPQRSISEFIFWEEIKSAAQPDDSLEHIIPEGRHVNLSACKSNESAWEKDGESVFTKYLTEILTRTKGAISYFDLKSRVRLYIKNQHPQTPQIYSSEDDNDLFLTFLGKQAEGKPLYGNVVYNIPRRATSGNWIMDIGALQGISERTEEIIIENEAGTVKITAKPAAVAPGFTYLGLSPEDEVRLDKSEQYRGYVEDFHSAPIALFIANPEKDEAAQSQLLSALKQIKNINISQEEAPADFTLLIRNQQYLIVLPGDINGQYERPLLKQEQTNENGLKKLNTYLRQMAQWAYLKYLYNPNVFLFDTFPLEIKCWKVNKQFDDTQDEPLAIKRDLLTIPFETVTYTSRRKRTHVGQNLKFSFTNKWKKELHFALLIMSMDFGVTPGAFKPGVQTLAPGQSIFACNHMRNGDVTPFTRMTHIKEFKWPAETVYLKILVSTDKSALQDAVTQFTMKGLPIPKLNQIRGGEQESTVLEKNAKLHDWMTRMLEIRFLNL